LCCATALHSTITSPPTIKCAKAVLVGLLTALAVLNLGYGFQGTGKALGE
jgi:predicted RecA/RadA family phage recombinase